MNPFDIRFPCGLTRRQAFVQMGNGFFGTALTYLLARDGVLRAADAPAADPSAAAVSGPASPMAPKPPHFPAKAKACIFLYMVGGPSQVDTFDPKPELAKRNGEEHSFKSAAGTSQKTKGKLKGAPWKFARGGKSGLEVSELLPNLAGCADDLAVIRSTCADSAAHGGASLQMNTGYIRQGFPSVGSWATYGLGTVNQNMPGFVVMVNGAPYSGAQNWAAGFMPAAYQGTVFNTVGDPIMNLQPAGDVPLAEQRRRLDLLGLLNRSHAETEPFNSELAARIASYELAYRMQIHAPQAVSLQDENPKDTALYGIGDKETDRFGRSCLMARRLVERGVRFVQIFHSNWDTHGNNDNRHKKLCGEIDRPIAGLITDLKHRGLLDSTLIVWAGEFGRTPIGGTEPNGGRDHHAAGFSTWMAGGGVKGGTAWGATDELGFHAVQDRVHVHDLHATILHLMGLDHERLTYRYSGRDFRLTDVAGSVVKGILA